MRLTIETQNDYESLSVCELLKFLKTKDNKTFSTILLPGELESAEKENEKQLHHYHPEAASSPPIDAEKKDDEVAKWTWKEIARHLGVTVTTAMKMNTTTGKIFVRTGGTGRSSKTITSKAQLDTMREQYKTR